MNINGQLILTNIFIVIYNILSKNFHFLLITFNLEFVKILPSGNLPHFIIPPLSPKV